MNDVDISSVDRAIAQFCERELSNLFSLDEKLDHSELIELTENIPFRKINITLRVAGKLRGSMSGTGLSLTSQLTNAIVNASNDHRFGGPLCRGELERTSIEVWILRKSRLLSLEQRLSPHAVITGIHGVSLKGRGKTAYFKPSVGITAGYKTSSKLFDALCRKAGLQADDWRSEDIAVSRTEWTCVHVSSGTNPTLLRQLRKSTSSVESKDLRLWMEASVGYLRNHQLQTGAINYLYKPLTDKTYLSEGVSNIVRQAGCAYALAVASSFPFTSRASLGTAQRLIEFIRKRVNSTPFGLAVSTDAAGKEFKLGATALLCCALQVLDLKEYADVTTALLTSLKRAQSRNLRFISHFNTSIEDLRLSEFYSGQALLALVLSAERGDYESLDMACASFGVYRAQFRASPSTAFVGWHVTAWARIATLTRDAAQIAFVWEQVEWLMALQIVANSNNDHIGGFTNGKRGPTFSTILYVEGLLSARTLARLVNLGEMVSKLDFAITLGLAFCARLRIESVPMSFLPNPNLSQGGVCFNLADKKVRCDVVQHFITMCALAVPPI